MPSTVTTNNVELTEESRQGILKTRLYRIRATADIPAQRVTRGDLGGWVESLETSAGEPRLSDNAWVFDNASVYGDARISGNAAIRQDAQVFGEARVSGDAIVSGKAQIWGTADVSGESWVAEIARVYEQARVTDRARVRDRAWVFGEAVIQESAVVGGTALVRDSAAVRGKAQIIGPSQVRGNAELTESWHSLALGPIGPHNATLTVNRTRDDGHLLELQGWTGTIAELRTDLQHRPAAFWESQGLSRSDGLTQFELALSLAEFSTRRWQQ
ncbi:polymer-forming cytoskeletal protein [Lysinibacter cavernae]|uniref:Carbonic anhydrase/acetyltransferase-like protein (Isoleucine patch superfamily) n=1 Tax=Lysinibacter cavernae TaxID=1640652 RepID=A0A7X5R475_9MICO|nr:polymer-forming cytoskeletal protein [Lysinibacter cavernae]NIH55350.1 carbonic anhydrase/acetyltransferase-like protein (isoleucine patch superfamily) [Lysinibacter cavernae]